MEAYLAAHKFKDSGRAEAERKYSGHRVAANKDVYQKIQLDKKYKLDEIGPAAFRTFEEVWLTHKRPVDWNWPDEVRYWRNKCISRLELSIWHDKHLCGLMICNTSKNKKILYIHGIEGAPYKHPLKNYVMFICLEVVDAYATLIKCDEIRIDQPDHNLIPWYCELGFNKVSNILSGFYLTKKMGE